MKLNYNINNKVLSIILDGEFLNYNTHSKFNDLFNKINSNEVNSITIDGNNIKKWDSTLVVSIFKLIKISNKKGISIELNSLPDGIKKLLHLAFSVKVKNIKTYKKNLSFLEKIGNFVFNRFNNIKRGISFFLEVIKSIIRFFKKTATFRKIDFVLALEECGYKALAIVSLISFMVGLILAFVGANQLKMFGAEIYVASLVSIGMVRIMGPAMAGVIMAGRTGASYASTIGTMQVNDELNALKTMGFSIIDFLVLPRVLALTITMPILSMFADIVGIIGGASVGTTMLGIPFSEYWKISLETLSLTHFLVGIFHGYIYGWVISLCGCYFGVNCGKDADSVGKYTTLAVVYSIIWIVITTGIITLICEIIGI